MSLNSPFNRRTLLQGAAGAVSALALGGNTLRAASDESKNKICAFIKFVQSLSYDELAEKIAAMGFDGIEATVRKGGHVLPERVEDDLPRLVAALDKHNLEITVMASDVNRIDDAVNEKVLRTAAKLGVKRYRMGYYRYDLAKPILPQLDGFRPVLKELAAFNRELGISAVYQNHSGAANVGAPVWDLQNLLTDVDPREVGVAFDIRHATVEGGQSWPVQFRLMQPHLGAIYVKDFIWDGPRPENVPLGEGRVDKKFFKLLRDADYSGPISLHVEYLPQAGVEENLQALQTDLATLRKLLA